MSITQQPPKGYYQQLLPAHLSHVKLALSNIPMNGVVRVDSSPVLAALDAHSDPHAAYYAEGIRDGRFVAVQEVGGGRYWRPGELFFGS